jgi:hypothetical protein
MRKEVFENVGVKLRKRETKGCYEIRCCGLEAKMLSWWLYSGAEKLSLQRKYEQATKFWKWMPRKRNQFPELRQAKRQEFVRIL